MNDIAGHFAGMIVVGTIILVVIFLVFREVFCWYWKINEHTALLTEIRNLLAANEKSRGRVAQSASKQVSTAKFCSGCGATVVEGGSDFCQRCGAKL